MMVEQFCYRIEGVVQGVGFRQYTRQKAQSLGLKGYVKNLPDGAVECVAEGSMEQLEKLLQALQRGPAFSRVDSIRKEKVKAGTLRGFDINY